MVKLIIGSYTTEANAIDAVNAYELKGHEAKNIFILTNNSNSDELDNKTDVNVSSISQDAEESRTFFTKIKRLLINYPDIELDTIEKLTTFGLPKRQAETALKDVRLGKTLVIADDQLKMGHESPFDRASSL